MDLSTLYVREFAANELNAPATPGYGIEVEAENFDPMRRAAEARALSRYWNIKDDGSLRNNGVEFVSKFLPDEDVPGAVSLLYGRTRRMWRPSVRTGIHIHVNMLHLSWAQVLRVLEYYAFAEPLLFSYLGSEREENIYCVPWYRAPQEAELVSSCINRGDMFRLRESCKYSALFCGPMRTFGTIEFRHAPTFTTEEQMMLWWKIVRCIGDSYLLHDPVDLYTRGGASAVLNSLFGDMFPVFGLTYDEAEHRVTKCGADEVALLLRPCTYKSTTPWGLPGSFQVQATAAANDSSVFATFAATLLDERMRLVEPQEEYRPELDEDIEPEEMDSEEEEE